LFAFWNIINNSYEPAARAGIINNFYNKYSKLLPSLEQVKIYAENFKSYTFPGSTPKLLNKILQISNFPITFYVTPSMY